MSLHSAKSEFDNVADAQNAKKWAFGLFTLSAAILTTGIMIDLLVGPIAFGMWASNHPESAFYHGLVGCGTAAAIPAFIATAFFERRMRTADQYIAQSYHQDFGACLRLRPRPA